jgi:hypothetical protein
VGTRERALTAVAVAVVSMQIEAQLSPGRLLMFFDLEKPDGAPAPGGGREAEVERSAGKKRARDEPGPNKKKREKVMMADAWDPA